VLGAIASHKRNSPMRHCMPMTHSGGKCFAKNGLIYGWRYSSATSSLKPIMSTQNYVAPPATPSVPVDDNRKPKHLSQWTNADVIKWLRRHCEHSYEQYGDLFLKHEITGRSLCRITDNMLERMGIGLQDHRDELRRIIMKLKLKSDMVKLKDLERT